MTQSWSSEGKHVEPEKITIPGFGTLTRRGELVLALLAVLLFVIFMFATGLSRGFELA